MILLKISILISVILVIIVIVGVFTVVGFGQEADEDSSIKIGFVNPLSGSMAYLGDQVKKGFELAHFLKPHINNSNIEIIIEDDKCNPEAAVLAVKKLIDFDDVDIIVDGVCSSSILAVAPITESAKKILLSPVAASPLITDSGDFVYRISSSSEIMAKQAATNVSELGFKKVGILYEKNDYPLGWKNSFVKYYSGEIMFIESFISDEQDLKTTITKIKDKDVDAILILALSLSSGQKILSSLQELGVKKQIIGNEIFAFKPILNMSASQGAYVSIYGFNLEDKQMKYLLEQYKNKYNKESDEIVYTALGFDVYNLVYNAISYCGSTDEPTCIKEYLDKTQTLSGATGEYYLNNKGDAIRTVALKKIVDNKLVGVN